MAQTPIGDLTDSSMKNLKTLIDSNSVIGAPITSADGTVILPVSKVSFGFASGGGDMPSSQKELFGGGSGGGVTITPIGFLVIKNGDVKLLQLQSYSSSADRALGMVPDVIDKVNGIISGLGKKDAEKPTEKPAENEATTEN
ncbi:MAG: spore germination protein GerW family protein [Angelakisella sp.]